MQSVSKVLSPLLLSASLVGVAACGNSASQEETVELAPVRVVAAVPGPSAPAIRTNGLLVNEDEIRLSFKVTGVIKHLPVNEGDRVRKGQKLAEIEQAEINAQVEQAQQSHEKARRDLERSFPTRRPVLCIDLWVRRILAPIAVEGFAFDLLCTPEAGQAGIVPAPR